MLKPLVLHRTWKRNSLLLLLLLVAHQLEEVLPKLQKLADELMMLTVHLGPSELLSIVLRMFVHLLAESNQNLF